MPVVIDVAAMDFPDGAQRFNWCNCQDAAALAHGLGEVPSDAAVTPIFDFSFWAQQLSGGGGAVPTPAASPGTVVLPGGHTTNFLLPALAIGAVGFWLARRGARR